MDVEKKDAASSPSLEMTDEERSQFLFSHVRAVLDAVPTEARDSNWLKASIVLNVRTKKEPKLTLGQMRDLRTILSDKGSEFQNFRSDLGRSMYPLTLSEHNYKRCLASWVPAEAWKEIRDAEDLTRAFGYQSFVNSGTLLGLIREGALLGHDDDADLGIILSGNSIPEIVRDLFRFKHKLKAISRLHPWHENQDGRAPHLLGNLPMDLFPCWELDGYMYLWPHGRLEVDKVLPLVEREIEGVVIHIPANPEALLEIGYGPTWRTPDTAFKYSWAKSASDTFKEFREEFKKQKVDHPELLKAG